MSRWTRAIAGVALLFFMTWSRSACAYPWMIRHEYVGCATCHADPSGGFILNAYGRAQSDLLLRMNYRGGESEEPDQSSGFLWGLVDSPDWLLPGGVFRGMALATKPDGAPTTTNLILMQADVFAGLKLGDWRGAVSLGGITSDGSGAAVIGNFVSREHWLGYAFAEDTILLRAGRLNVPFGIRSIEHTMFIRTSTRTDLNDTQQHGIALAYTGEALRGEIMGILGNYQISPDAFRERGYSAYGEWSPLRRVAVGVSSLVTHAAEDLYLRAPNTRQAHGLFARVAPAKPLVLLAEFDLEYQNLTGGPNLFGEASMLQADVEPIQGLHFMGTFETLTMGGPGSSLSYGEWLGAAWFFAPHADLRVDFVRLQLGGPIHADASSYLAQVHFFL